MKNSFPDKKITLISDKRFLRFFDIQYAEGKHYFAVSRRPAEMSFAAVSEKEGKFSLPDAVTVILIIRTSGGKERLYANYEYRYACGRFLLSPPAGLIDPGEREGTEKILRSIIDSDLSKEDSERKYSEAVNSLLRSVAEREVMEETGYDVKGSKFTVLSPFVFSSPGMSDESSALVKFVLDTDESEVTPKGDPGGSELFSGSELLSREDAKKLLASGRDSKGNFYSMPMYNALVEFINS